ncbi:MAG TPA: exosortase E/protease, VPEID-CTERM system [Polyangia bacterium]|jgi:exosortase E/protease (VPEID-CTERM system)
MKAGDLRLGAWLALLVLEGLALAVTFDSAALASLPHGWWTIALAPAGSIMPLAAAIGAALILVSWARPGSFNFPFRARSRAWLDVLVQVAVFAALFAVTAKLFALDDRRTGALSPERVGGLVAGWLALAAATAVTWLRIGMPLRTLGAVLRRRASLLLLAGALGAAAYAVGHLAQGLWLPLRRATFDVASLLLRGVVDDPIIDPDHLVIGTPRFTVEIAPECSGYEGVGLSWVFLGTALWLFRDRLRFPRAFLLLGVGTIVPWFANAGRLVALVLVGSYVSEDAAAGAFHSYAGAILFCAIALAIVALALRSPWLSVEPAAREPAGHAPDENPHERFTNPVAPYLVPFIALVAAGMLSRALSSTTHEPLALLRPLAGALALAVYARFHRRIAVWPSWFAVPAGLFVAGIWVVMEAIANPAAPTRAPTGLLGSGAAWMAIRGVAATSLVPVIEELAFRGFLARRLSSRDFERLSPRRMTLLGIVGAALAFGLLHRRPVAGTLAGLCYAVVYRHRGKLADAIVAHATTNAVLLVVAWALQWWDLWM